MPSTMIRISETAREQLRALAASSHESMQQVLEKAIDDMVKKSKADPRDVARVIARIATCKRPALRYLVGKDARVQAFAKGVLPFRAVEAAVSAIVKPKKRA